MRIWNEKVKELRQWTVGTQAINEGRRGAGITTSAQAVCKGTAISRLIQLVYEMSGGGYSRMNLCLSQNLNPPLN